MSRCGAWLLDLGGTTRAVIGQDEFLHLAQRPQIHQVPCAPAHCRQVALWEGIPLPLFQATVWADPAAAGLPATFVAVVGYQPAGTSTPAFGALALGATPQRIEVDDADACDLPPDLLVWRRISCACIARAGRALPVLDLGRLFESA